MGKAQSKRSVDITTAETAKDNANAVAEGAGELKKIDDVDQLKPQLNGDTHTTADETTGTEPKVESDAKETEKDATTKSAEPTTGSGDTAPIATPVTDDIANKTLETTASNDETLNESAKTTESAAAEDSGKKKKEKVKKKWSFRSISFSKKDKQKPVKDKKKEEEKEKATNGECEKVPEEVSDKIINLLDKKKHLLKLSLGCYECVCIQLSSNFCVSVANYYLFDEAKTKHHKLKPS